MYRHYKEGLFKMSDKLKIALVLSSTREGRLNDQVAKFVQDAMDKQHDVDIIDPATLDLPATQQSVNFLFNNQTAIPQHIKDLNEKMATYDAFIFVCPEYNWSLPPGLTNLMDNIPPTTVAWKPCGFINYSMGNLGGARAAVQLRTFTGALGMIPVPKQMAIPLAHEKIDKDGKAKDEKLTEELKLVLEHVYWAAKALKTYKATSSPPKWMPS